MKRVFVTYILSLVLVGRAFGGMDTPKVVKLAQVEIGNGEVGGNNKGEFVKLYNKGFEASWCAGFVSYILSKANVVDLGYKLSAKAIWNEARELGWTVEVPQAGDLIVFWRESPNSWKGHIGIVEKVDDDYVYTIEGNKGKYPAKVKRFKYNINDVSKLIGYIRLKGGE